MDKEEIPLSLSDKPNKDFKRYNYKDRIKKLQRQYGELYKIRIDDLKEQEEKFKSAIQKILERIDEPICFCERDKDFTGICRECLIDERVIEDTLRPDKRKRLIDKKVIKFILDTLHSHKIFYKEKIKEIIKSSFGEELC